MANIRQWCDTNRIMAQAPHSMPATIEGSGVIVDCITEVTVVRLHMELSKEGAG